VNVVAFHGIVLSAGIPKYIVTSFATGGSLKNKLQDWRTSQGGITLGQLVDIAVDVLEGLAYLHSLEPEPMILRWVPLLCPAAGG
jgi:serine/threonine protein kinase